MRLKTALSIAGSDSSGGAGIQADLKTMTCNGVFAMSAITALTAQNTTGVTGIYEVSPDFLGQQIDAVFTDIYPDAVKIGMVSSAPLIHVIAQRLADYDAPNIVVDPVMVATSGAKLLADDAIETLCTELLPLAAVATPNLAEAEILSGQSIESEADMRSAAETIAFVKDLIGQGAEALLFDVRFNPGGYADELVKVLDYLLPEGDLFRSVDYAGREEVDTSDASCVELPMAVLVNEDSYSAAEFFAAALQEYEWATIVGSQTYGKGNFQTAFYLSDGSMVNLSIGKYYTPGGKSLSETGVTPDVVVDLDDEQYALLYYNALEQADDPQFQAAIDTLTQKIS